MYYIRGKIYIFSIKQYNGFYGNNETGDFMNMIKSYNK